MIITASVFCPARNEEVTASLKIIEKDINILFSLDQVGYNHILDTIGSLWEIYSINNITDITRNLDENSDKNIKNIGLIHHGGLYSSSSNADSLRWPSNKVIEKVLPIAEALYGNLKITSSTVADYLAKLKNLVSIEINYGINPEWEKPCNNACSILTYMKLLFDCTSDEGNYISIACNEAENPDFLKTLGSLTNQRLTLYANTAKTTIRKEVEMKYGINGVIRTNSILNVPLTDEKNSSGWKSYDTTSKEIISVNKDIIIHSVGNKPFSFVKLNSFSKEKVVYTIFYYSKKYKNLYNGKNGWTIEKYNEWKKVTKSKYSL